MASGAVWLSLETRRLWQMPASHLPRRRMSQHIPQRRQRLHGHPAACQQLPDASGHNRECERGFSHGARGCVAVPVPQRAYPTCTLFGRGWQRQRGYAAQDDSCVAVRVPANAFLQAAGHG